MASSVFTEAILVIAIAIAGSMIVATLNSNTQLLLTSYKSAVHKAEIRTKENLQIVFATVLDDGVTIKVWIKNTGEGVYGRSIIQRSCLLLGNKTVTDVYFYGLSSDNWNYTLFDTDDDEMWGFGETVEITLILNRALSSGNYFVRFVSALGYCTEDFYFSYEG